MPKTKQLRLVIADRGPAILAAIIVVLCFTWMTTYGTFEVFEPEHFGQFYDAQASALLAGHWNVPPETIFPEGFYRDGKAYGYFGFVPALPRMLLNQILPGMTGAWSRLSAILACAVTLFCCDAILRRVRKSIGCTPPGISQRWADAAFLLLAGLGSTVIYLGSRAFIYDEAILWGVALAMGCYVQLFDYLAECRWRNLIAACALAYLSFFTRISSGLGPMLALLLVMLSVIPRPPRRLRIYRGIAACGFANQAARFRISTRIDRRSRKRPWTRINLRVPRRTLLIRQLLITATLATIVTTYVIINHAKFGTYLQPAPMRLHGQIALDPSRLTRTGGNWMSLGNVPTTAYAYLSPSSVRFHREFPWVYLRENLRLLPGQHLDGSGTFSSVTAAMPVLVILGLLGYGYLCVASSAGEKVLRQQPRVPVSMILFGSLGPIAAVLAFSNVEFRYLHEFFPLLILGSAFGVECILSIKNAAIRLMLISLLLVGSAAQIYANCAFALVYQRLLVFDAPLGPANQFRHWQQTIDRIFERG